MDAHPLTYIIVAGSMMFIPFHVLGTYTFSGASVKETPLQLFFPTVPNQMIAFPTGMIPLFIVPYAIFFHTLSGLNQSRFNDNEATR